MKIPMDNESPESNLIEFRKPRQGNFAVKKRSWDSCRHARVFIDEEKRETTCQECRAVLDAFTVLLELAYHERRWLEDLDAWDARRESLLSERYDEQWAQDHEGVLAPPEDLAQRKIWDTFHALIGDKFCRMYCRKRRKRSGPEWYGVSTDGACLSYEYARSRLTPRAVGK